MTVRADHLLALALALAVPGCRGHERREERRDDRQDRRAERRTQWERLGERWVHHGGADHDAILVTAAEGRFSAIRIDVQHSALELFDVKVTFADGSDFSPATQLVFGKGETSRVIDLPGGDRVIRRVDFRYRNLPGGGRAQVELWGR